MLRQLMIRDLAVIAQIELDLTAGFTVLTGETGAGKSILIDAVGLALGARGDTGMVRPARKQAEVVADFEVDNIPAVRDWLSKHALADPDEPSRCVVRRVLSTEGRNRAFVNDRPASLGTLRELGESLVEIFGQGESRTLMRGDVQRELLDRHGKHDKELHATALAAGELTRIEREIERLRQAATRDPAHTDFLRFQLQELEALGLGENELEALESEHKRLTNASRLLEEGDRARLALNGGEDCAYDTVSSALQLLRSLAGVDPAFAEAVEAASNAQIQIEEAARTVRRLCERADLDPTRLTELDQRMSAIHELARKHRRRASELPEVQRQLGRQLDELASVEQILERLEGRRGVLEARYHECCERLTELRRAAAPKLAETVEARLQRLGIPNARFAVALEEVRPAPVSAQGVDQVRFEFSANPGQPLRPLAKVASGGELSRLGLAIQVCAGGDTGIPTMIFDEVDAGIGGGVAEIVGAELRGLAANRQVLCVTHLPQVAAHGTRHLGIRKQVRGGQTFTSVETLDHPARVDELARMAGGREVTDAATAHARELLDRASAG